MLSLFMTGADRGRGGSRPQPHHGHPHQHQSPSNRHKLSRQHRRLRTQG